MLWSEFLIWLARWTYESWRVVVVNGFSVAERLQHRIAEQQLLPNRFQFFGPAAGVSQILKDQFGGLRFARSALSGDDDHLIAVEISQRPPGIVG